MPALLNQRAIAAPRYPTPSSDTSWVSDAQPILGLRVITVDGEVDRAAIAWLWGRCLAEAGRGARIVVIDFSRMTGCPSALFLTSSQIKARFRATTVALHLHGLTDAVSTIVGVDL